MLSGLKDEKNNTEWDKWHVFWVDERCVPLDDPESNFGGAYEALFKDVPIPRENLHTIDDSLYTMNTGASEKSAEAYDKELKSLSEAILPRGDGGLPIFDLLLLGFGPDGHICSLFPEPFAGESERRAMDFTHHRFAKTTSRTHHVFYASGEHGETESVCRCRRRESRDGETYLRRCE